MRPGRGLLGLRKLLGTVEGHERVDGDDKPAATAELFGDTGSDPTPAAGHDGDLLPPAHDVVEPDLELQALQAAGLEPLLQPLAVAEPVTKPAAVVAVPRVPRLRVALVVDARRRAGSHHGTAVDPRIEDLLRPRLLGLRAHVEDLHTPLLEHPHCAADEISPEHGQLGVVDGHHRLLARRRHDEHVRETPAHHPEQAGSTIGPLLGQRDTATTDDLVAGTTEKRGEFGLEPGCRR